MPINVNCQYIKNHTGCTNKLVKRSLFGLGFRMCVEYPYPKATACEFKLLWPRPKFPPKRV